MAAILYTTTEAVRAALGVTAREIEDAQITDLGIVDQLELDLVNTYPTHETLKAAIDGNTATDAEKLVWKRLKLYLQYLAAYIVAVALQNLVAQKVTDGDAEMQRFMKDNLSGTIERIEGMKDKYLAELNPDAVVTGADFPMLAIAIPDRDPVTEA